MAGGEKKAGCGGTLLLVLIGLIIVARCLGKKDDGHAEAPPKAPESTETAAKPAGPVVSAKPSTSAATSGSAAAQLSAFGQLWAAAQDVTSKEANLRSVLSLQMSKENYCRAFGCGDEFSQDEVWKNTRELAKLVQTVTWRAELPAARTSFLGAMDSSGKTDKLKPGFFVEKWVPERLEFPISVVWPIELAGIKCAPRRPQLEVFTNGAGNDERKWAQFDVPLFAAKFASADDAKTWKTDPKIAPKLYAVFRVTGGAFDTWKADAIYDFGAKDLALVKVIGAQLVDRGKIVHEWVDPSAKK